MDIYILFYITMLKKCTLNFSESFQNIPKWKILPEKKNYFEH